MDGCSLVFDVGKTNVKIATVDASGAIRSLETTPTPAKTDAPYRAIDVDAIFTWFLDKARNHAHSYHIDRIIPVAHGSAAAVVGAGGELVLPLLDYEFDIPPNVSRAYDAVRPSFLETASPALPSGLNLGRQLFWLQHDFPQAFAQAATILLYPQYWAWRFSGVAASEVTSLGCHTDLWSPQKGTLSSLPVNQGWDTRLPSLRSAWEVLGALKGDIAKHVGLPTNCKVFCGVHDSNAALFPLTVQEHDGSRRNAALLSTGTWFIAMWTGGKADGLDEKRDCLANVDVHGKPFACSRFMGGREFDCIVGAEDGGAASAAEVQVAINEGSFATPAFVDAGGPFPRHRGSICRAQNARASLKAIGALYQALVADQCLSMIGAQGDLVVEGPASGNIGFLSALSALRPPQHLYVRDVPHGVTLGAAAIGCWPKIMPLVSKLKEANVTPLHGAMAYRDAWMGAIERSVAP